MKKGFYVLRVANPGEAITVPVFLTEEVAIHAATAKTQENRTHSYLVMESKCVVKAGPIPTVVEEVER